jgi:hypothetical protein
MWETILTSDCAMASYALLMGVSLAGVGWLAQRMHHRQRHRAAAQRVRGLRKRWISEGNFPRRPYRTLL